MDHKQTSANSETFHITSRRTSHVGLNQHALPANRVLELTSADARGYLSAHRALAKAHGWTTKAGELRVYSGEPSETLVRTYWLPPTTIRTWELPDIALENRDNNR